MARGKPISNRLGRDFESRVASRWGGTRITGQTGDVQVDKYIVECKFRTGLSLESGSTLKGWHDQMLRYEKMEPTQKVILAYSGGRTYQNASIFVSMREEEFLRLKRLDEDQQIIEAFKAEKAGDFDHAKHIIQALAVALARQMVTGGQSDVVDLAFSGSGSGILGSSSD